uniref:G_PROTEIN_RECEP_F1_2 domain-containing protein n=1 Tax=Parastrongyloides trichosuri TaxID=131310 RepID=A0A0N5A0C7_PARTI
MISEKIIAVLCYFVICSFGFTINLYCFFKIRKLKDFKNCFGYICICQVISNIVTCTIFLCWACPSILFLKEDTATYEFINLIFGKISILIWNLNMYSHIAASFNRFIAIYFPIRYTRIFDRKTVTIIISLIWFLSFCHVVPYIFFGCIYRFSIDDLTWNFVSNKCTDILSSLDLYLSLSNVVISLFLDILNFIKLGIHAKKSGSIRNIGVVTKSQITMVVTNAQNKNKSQTQKKTSNVYNNRIRFFFQSFVQSLIIAVELMSFHIFVKYATSKIWAMIATSCAWALCHTLDGVILCFFNKEIRSGIPCFKF